MGCTLSSASGGGAAAEACSEEKPRNAVRVNLQDRGGERRRAHGREVAAEAVRQRFSFDRGSSEYQMHGAQGPVQDIINVRTILDDGRTAHLNVVPPEAGIARGRYYNGKRPRPP